MESNNDCHPIGPINVVYIVTTRKDNNKYQTANIVDDQNSTSIINKIMKSNSHEIKSKRNNLTCTSLEKI